MIPTTLYRLDLPSASERMRVRSLAKSIPRAYLDETKNYISVVIDIDEKEYPDVSFEGLPVSSIQFKGLPENI